MSGIVVERLLALLMAAGMFLVSACGGPGAANNTGTDVNGESNVALDQGNAAVSGGSNNMLPTPSAGGAAQAAPEYEFTVEKERQDFYDEDGTLLAYYAYQRPSMEVVNEDALSPQDKEAAQRAMDTFNGRMSELMNSENSEVKQYAQYDYENGMDAGLPYYKETETRVTLCGQVASVRINHYYNMGGAHPNCDTGGLLFDMTSGQFIAPGQLADDQNTFQHGVAERLIEKADGLGEEYTTAYFPDYQDTLRAWEVSGAVIFASAGMTVIFSPYILGPYAMGPVELTLDYEELSSLIGPGGMAKLGQSAQ